MSNTLIAGVELGQSPERFRIEKHRVMFFQSQAVSPAYVLIDSDGENWIFTSFGELMREVFRDITLDLSPEEYAHVYALRDKM